jgi:hypothetical protein
MSVFVTVSKQNASQRGLGSHRPHGTRAGLMNEPWKKTKKNIFILKVFRSLRTFTSFTTLPSTVLPSTSILLSFVSPFLPPSAWCWKFPHHYHFIPLSTLHFTSFPHLRHSFCFNFQLSLLSHTTTMTIHSLFSPHPRKQCNVSLPSMTGIRYYLRGKVKWKP